MVIAARLQKLRNDQLRQGRRRDVGQQLQPFYLVPKCLSTPGRWSEIRTEAEQNGRRERSLRVPRYTTEANRQIGNAARLLRGAVVFAPFPMSLRGLVILLRVPPFAAPEIRLGVCPECGTE